MTPGATGGTARGRRQYGRLAEINVTPLVDVMLVLLIIFMLTAPFIAGGVEVNLPHTRTTAKASVEGLVITVDKQRRVYIDENVIQLAQLKDVLAEIRPGGGRAAGLSAQRSGSALWIRRARDGHDQGGRHRGPQSGGRPRRRGR